MNPDGDTPLRSDAIDVLADGAIEIVGRLLASTNQAMLCRVALPCPEPEAPVVVRAVYKPIGGERPLDDFPDGTLAHREVGAFLVSEASGWAIVPATVLRDGPFGPGMLQQWVDVDPHVDVVEMVLGDDTRLRRIAAFDAVVNNADRKGGHLLPVPGGHVFGVDHGVCFSPMTKLRTVLWGWRGEPFSDDEVAVLDRLRTDLGGDLGERLAAHLSPREVTATRRRLEVLLRSGRFPQPTPNWPAIPWPPF